jgi:hypothetical protein
MSRGGDGSGRCHGRRVGKSTQHEKPLMTILSNSYFFPLLQFALLALVIFAIWRDRLIQLLLFATIWRDRPRATLAVTRGPESMGTLEKITGLVIAAIITVINKSVFDDNEAGWKHYSAVTNAFDLIAIIYLCYISPWGRNHIFALNERLKKELR